MTGSVNTLWNWGECMIESKKITAVTAIAVCVALITTFLMIGLGDGETAKAARQPGYVTQLFGGEVISIQITADETDWQEMLDNASAKEYIMADVTVNGVKFQNVGVRPKGNASLSQTTSSSSPERYSLRISFDEYIENQTCFGLDTLILNNMISDSTYMKEYISQDIMRYIGVESPLTGYADISVNGEGFGFYVALEYYGDSYTKRVYEDKTGNFYNVKTMQMGGGGAAENREDQNNQEGQPGGDDWNDREGFIGRGGGSSGGTLQYTDDDISSYSAIFENSIGNVSESEQQKVLEALKNLDSGTDLEKYFDVDEILRYFAAHTVVVNLDSYVSNMAQNYVLYERNGQISVLPWDYHLSFGAFQSGSASDVVNFSIDTPVSGVNMEERPLLNELLKNEEYLAKYHEYLQEIVTGYFNSGLFEQTVRDLQFKIEGYVENDPSAFYTLEEFNTGVDTFVRLNLLRAESIAGQLEGTIPSTSDGQKADSSALVDASSIDMSDLGSSGMGGAGGEGNFPGNLPDGGQGNFPGQNGGMPDMELMQKAMQIIQDSGGEITEEVKARLVEMGLSEEQITMLSDRGAGQGGARGQ